MQPIRCCQRARSVLTIHNIGYQGIMPSARRAPILGWATPRRGWMPAIWRDGVINSLKTGIKFADVVTTVSPTYAREICEAPLGMGMQDALRARQDRVVGISERRRLPGMGSAARSAPRRRISGRRICAASSPTRNC